MAAVARRQRGETLGHETVRLGAQRAVEQLRLLQQAQTVVVAAVHVHYPGMQLERFDGGQETGALQPVLVQAVGLDVGGGHQGDALIEQGLHQGAENHGVGDVGDEELVETEHPIAGREFPGDAGERVFLALPVAQLAVHFLHEAVEVHAPLFLERQALEEYVHQVGLAAPHAAPHIQALEGLALALAQARQQPLGGPVFKQAVVQMIERANRLFLGRVAHEFRAGQIGLILLERRHDVPG